MRKILQGNRGESIVEVLVSFLMLLIVVGAFTTAIRGANAMMTKAGEIRKQAFDLELKLYPTDGSVSDITDSTTNGYTFTQTDPTGSGTFTIKARLGDIKTEAGGTTHIFREYRAEATP